MEACDFKPIIGGVLKAAGLSRQHIDYDDYFQELWVILWNKLKEVKDVTPVHNNQLFSFLLWRLKDLQRREWRYQKRKINFKEIDISSYEDDYLTLWQDFKLNLSDELQPIFQHVLDFPDMSMQARSKQLKIHRKTLRRRLDAIGAQIK